jgi:hypothetical protein
MNLKSKHFLIMLICCLIPVAGFAVVTVFNIPLNTVLWFALMMLCPLSHIILMKYMMPGHNHHEHAAHQVTDADVKY